MVAVAVEEDLEEDAAVVVEEAEAVDSEVDGTF